MGGSAASTVGGVLPCIVAEAHKGREGKKMSVRILIAIPVFNEQLYVRGVLDSTPSAAQL